MRLDDANTGDTLLPVVPADRDYEIADHTVTTRVHGDGSRCVQQLGIT